MEPSAGMLVHNTISQFIALCLFTSRQELMPFFKGILEAKILEVDCKLEIFLSFFPFSL